MKIFYSIATNRFCREDFHEDMPADCREVSPSLHAAAAARSVGLVLDADGNFVLGKPAPLVLNEAEARIQRDGLLTASDWTQLPDVPEETRNAWAAYRQALRDVPRQTGFPALIVWPLPPA